MTSDLLRENLTPPSGGRLRQDRAPICSWSLKAKGLLKLVLCAVSDCTLVQTHIFSHLWEVILGISHWLCHMVIIVFQTNSNLVWALNRNVIFSFLLLLKINNYWGTAIDEQRSYGSILIPHEFGASQSQVLPSASRLCLNKISKDQLLHSACF